MAPNQSRGVRDMARRWQLQDAKARFSEVVERAMAGEAQVVTRRGRPAVAVIPYEQYDRMQGTTSAWDLFQGAPRLSEDDLPIARDASLVQPVELD